MRKTAFIPAATMLVVAQVFWDRSYDDHSGRIIAAPLQVKEAMKKYRLVRHGKHASA